MDAYGFYTGQSFDAYEWLGAHVEGERTVFRTFAPNASGVCLLYGQQEIPMMKVYDGNFYETTVDKNLDGVCYEYRIYRRDGRYTDHCDPYGFGMELRPNHQSIVREQNTYEFYDGSWMRKRNICEEEPLNIYEIHAGSWKKDGEQWYTYDMLGEQLIPYLKQYGYNYVEFMPIGEYPCDESWGYQTTGFYAPTSRYGTGDQLRKMIDTLHQHNIGVILDFVPVHFAVDSYGLGQYDGSALYEYPNYDVGVSEWGSYNFMHSRGEVRSFLQSCANYWLKEYHFDGLRMDAISRIIYWNGEERRGVNGNALDFIKVMNQGVKERNRGCMLIAEDSTNFPNVTKPVEQGGLGFDYKWDMGWMHDTLSYFQTGPEYRTENYHKLTFSMMYHYQERYLLPLSHDEVVHGKATILQKMYGQYEDKFPQGRAFYLYMMVHPGKKLNFMGNEFGQLREWDEKREQDWLLFEYPIHGAFLDYMKELNQLYQSHPALYEKDCEQEGFCWLDCHQEDRCIYALLRKGKKERLAAVFNFSNQPQSDYQVDIPDGGQGKVLLYTDWKEFGGNTPKERQIAVLEKGKLICSLAPFSGVLLQL